MDFLMIESFKISMWEFAGERIKYSHGSPEGDVHVVAVATLPFIMEAIFFLLR